MYVLFIINFYLISALNQFICQANPSQIQQNHQMSKYLLALVLLLAGAMANSYFLSPPLLPTAFEEQYYEVRYRVRGLPYASFTFDNLPDFLKGSKNGIVSGTPTITGTFRFTVKFADGEESGSEEAILSVSSSPNTAASNEQNKDVVELIVTTALNSWIYRVNDQIDVQLGSKGGKAPITWTYRNLPEGLLGDATGKIYGTVKEAGLYSFSANCGDSIGQKASSYYTLNVQPGTLIKTNNIIDVPDRNAPLVYDIKQVEAQQIAADLAVTEAMGVVADATAVLKEFQRQQAKTQLALNLAIDQQNAAELTQLKLQHQYDNAVEVHHRAQANLGTAKNIVGIATTAVKNAQDNLKAAEANLAAAQASFDKSSAAFKKATDAYTVAKNELSQAELDHKNAVDAFLAAENANNIAWNNVQDRKLALDAANDKWLDTNQTVANARNNLDLTATANDDAITQLKIADSALTAAQKTLEEANKLVAALRAEWSSSSSSLGTAKFNLQQALNNLFVAQAAKAAADKAVAIAFAQGVASLDLMKGESTYVFEGCSEQVYPVISGTVPVSVLLTSGARLNSGQILTWGGCTHKPDIIVEGDVVSFTGTINNGVISATEVKKL